MTWGGYAMYDKTSGKPAGFAEMEKEEIRTWASLLGKKLVFPEDLPSQRTHEYIPEMHYTQGVLFGSEGTSPDIYGEGRCCPCWAEINSYNHGPLCGSCQLKIFDLEQELPPFVISFLRLFWPDLYMERMMTKKVIDAENGRGKTL